MAKLFEFQGKAGQYVPGLPRRLTDSEAKELGLEDLLEECIEAKLYKEVKPKGSSSKKEG